MSNVSDKNCRSHQWKVIIIFKNHPDHNHQSHRSRRSSATVEQVIQPHSPYRRWYSHRPNYRLPESSHLMWDELPFLKSTKKSTKTSVHPSTAHPHYRLEPGQQFSDIPSEDTDHHSLIDAGSTALLLFFNFTFAHSMIENEKKTLFSHIITIQYTVYYTLAPIMDTIKHDSSIKSRQCATNKSTHWWWTYTELTSTINPIMRSDQRWADIRVRVLTI